MKKRILAALLCLVLLVAGMPPVPVAASTVGTWDAFTSSYRSTAGDDLFDNFLTPLTREQPSLGGYQLYMESLLDDDTYEAGLLNPVTLKLNAATTITWVSTFHDPNTVPANPVIVISRLDPNKTGYARVVESKAYATAAYDSSLSNDSDAIAATAIVAVPNVALPAGEYAISVRGSASLPMAGFDVLSSESLLVSPADLNDYMLNTLNASDALHGSMWVKGITEAVPVGTSRGQQTKSLNLNNVINENLDLKEAADEAALKAKLEAEAKARIAHLNTLPNQYGAFAKTLSAAPGFLLYDTYLKMLNAPDLKKAYNTTIGVRNGAGKAIAGPRSALSFKLAVPTKITWVAAYNAWWAEAERTNMVIVISSLNPKGILANKVTKSWIFPATCYYAEYRFQFVATPNISFPAGEYSVSIRTADQVVASAAMDFSSESSLLLSPPELTTKAETDMVGSFSIKGVPYKLPAGTPAFTRTNTLNYSQLVANINAYWAAVAAAQAKQTAAAAAAAAVPPKITVNGVATGLQANVYGGVTFVPAKVVAEALDFSAAYDSAAKVLRIADNDTGNANVIFTVDQKTVRVLTAAGWYDDQLMAASARIVNGAVYVPLATLANVLGLKFSTVKGVLYITGGVG